ncbi:MAG: tryptophan synthase subunit alpha [Cellvibrionales bacterium]|nr:tryptophan synthase subunit alpha [Cellvibrionales bacterium]
MSRLTPYFEQLKSQNKKALIPYVVAGDPDLETTLAIMHQSVESGADILEIGVPFSDPMAEGPVIQAAHERALEHNVSLADTLALVAKFRETNDHTPVLLMGYANPVEAMGYPAFADRAKTSGVDAVLLVDMPPEESVRLQAALKPHGIDNIFLISPTTNDDRIAKIANVASGFLYYVSLKGVTGAGHFDIRSVEENLARISQFSDLPVCVGFGIKDADSARQVAKVADGVVVGSAVVKLIEASKSNVLEPVGSFIRSLNEAIIS